MRSLPILIATTIVLAAPNASAQVDIDVLAGTTAELTDEQKADLEASVTKRVGPIVKKCVGEFPRPEFFTQLSLKFELRRSGELRGGYMPSAAIDSSLYSASDEEREKLSADGSFAQVVAVGDRDLERCLKTETRTFDSKTSRIAAKVTLVYDVKWKGKTPTLTIQQYDITQ